MYLALAPRPRRSLRTAGAALALGLLIAGCGADGDGDAGIDEGVEPLQVTAAFYPIQEAAEGVGGSEVEVTGLTPPGQGPHDLELEPRQVDALADADVVFFLGRGFQPQVEDAVAGLAGDVLVVDLLDHVELLTVDEQLQGTTGEVDGEVLEGDVDPHVWLDPARMIEMVEVMTSTLSDVRPDAAPVIQANSAEYLEGLTGLDGEYEEALGTCASRVIVTSHRAFGYLADRYELRQIPIAGVSPEVEPDPQTLEAIAAEARAEGVTTIFLEEIAPPDLAETVAAEVGADLSLLDPIEGLPEGEQDDGVGYASIMRENLDRLVSGLGCS